MSYCPECGGNLRYNPAIKSRVCQSCGLSLTHQELLELREKEHQRPETPDERRERMKKDYLRWWFKNKKEKSRG